MKAVLVLTRHKVLGKILTPALNIERDSINWQHFGYGGQSGQIQTVLSFVYCIFCDSLPPAHWGFRDPFEGFCSLDPDIQVLLIESMAVRHGLNDFSKSNSLEE
jgi:hypothetical protein